MQQVTGGVGNCVDGLAIPADAVAIAMNVTAVAPTAQTNIRIYPADVDGVPLVSNLNVVAGQAPFPNKVDVRLSPDGAVKIFNQSGAVSLVGDVVGYYTSSTLRQTVSDIETSSRSQVTVRGWTKVTEQYGITSRQEGIVIATFEIFEATDNDRVQCGLGRATGSQPDLGPSWTWESPDQGDYTAQTLHTNFKGVSSIALFCRVIENGGEANITGVEMTVLATGMS